MVQRDSPVGDGPSLQCEYTILCDHIPKSNLSIYIRSHTLLLQSALVAQNSKANPNLKLTRVFADECICI